MQRLGLHKENQGVTYEKIQKISIHAAGSCVYYVVIHDSTGCR